MQLRDFLLFLILVLLITSCDKEDKKITEPPEGCINLSELETRQNYYLPFALENDNDSIRVTILNNDTIDFSYDDFLEFKENGFYELVLVYKDSQQKNDPSFLLQKPKKENIPNGVSGHGCRYPMKQYYWVRKMFRYIILTGIAIQ
jgi:hypothetical protein